MTVKLVGYDATYYTISSSSYVNFLSINDDHEQEDTDDSDVIYIRYLSLQSLLNYWQVPYICRDIR